MNPTEQKSLASLVVNALKSTYGNATIAGGAARDWHLGVPAQDIDIFITVDKEEQLDLAPDILGVTPFRADGEYSYQNNKHRVIRKNENVFDILHEMRDFNLLSVGTDGEGPFIQVEDLSSNSIYNFEEKFTVWNAHILSQDFQIILTMSDVMERIAQFPLNISKVYMLGDISMPFDEAREGLTNKTLVFGGPTLTDSYMDKMIKRFPSYKVVKK